MRRLVLLGLLLAPLAAIAFGCAKPTSLPVATGPVALVEVRADGLNAALDERKGQVVLVDFWATWCPPCRARFPHFVETHNKYMDKGLACMSVSLDNDGPGTPTDKEKVLDFLKAKGASFPNFLLVDYAKDAVQVGRRFGLEGGIPFVALFDKTGKKVWDRGQKELSDRELDKLIESELAK